MKMNRLLSLLLVLILLLSFSPAAFAAVEFATDNTPFSGEHDATVLLAGRNPVSSADVRGILFSVGSSVSVDGGSEYAVIGGNNVALNGTCGRDAFVVGATLGVTGSVERDLIALGNRLNLSGSVGRDLYFGGKSVLISGKIGGDVLLKADEIQIASDAEIGGTLRYNSSAKITAPADLLAAASTYSDGSEGSPVSAVSAQPVHTAAPVQPAASAEPAEPAQSGTPAEPAASAVPVETAAPAQTAQPLQTIQSPQSSEPAPASRPSFFGRVKGWLFSYVGLVLLAFALLWLTPLWEKLDKDYAGADLGKYAAVFGIGFAVLLALPIAVIILMITGIGLRPALVLLFLYIAAIIAAPVFLGFFLGVLIWRKLLKRTPNYQAELPIGLLVWRIVSLIPGIKFAASVVTVPLALGVLTRMLGKKKKKASAMPVPAAAAKAK